MDSFQLGRALGTPDLSMGHMAEVILRLLVAVILGGVVAYRPWRRLTGGRVAPPRAESAQAQTLIAAAGALMVAVIGDSMARAFGLVGLGAFIRFRSGIKDPRDAAVLFVMIGIGMACGLGAVPLAVAATLFVSLVLALFDLRARPSSRSLRVGIDVANPQAALPAIRLALGGVRVIAVPAATPEAGKVVVGLDASDEVDAMHVMEILRREGITGVRSVSLEEE